MKKVREVDATYTLVFKTDWLPTYVCAVSCHCLDQSRSIQADLPCSDGPRDHRGGELAVGSSMLPVRRSKRLGASWSGVIWIHENCCRHRVIQCNGS